MIILSISLEESKITELAMLDWLCSPEVNKGIVNNKFWLVDTDTHIAAENMNYQIELMNNLLMQAKANGYTSIQIRKDVTITNTNSERSSEQQSGDSGTTEGTSTQVPADEIPPTPLGTRPDREESQ